MSDAFLDTLSTLLAHRFPGTMHAWNLFDPFFRALLLLMALDFVTGLLASIKQKRINSSVGKTGAIIKAGMIIAVVALRIVGRFVDLPLGTILCFIFALFEVVSLFENLDDCNVPLSRTIVVTIRKFRAAKIAALARMLDAIAGDKHEPVIPPEPVKPPEPPA